MKIVVLNASPRKKANTAELCKNVVKGAESNGADVEYLTYIAMILKDV